MTSKDRIIGFLWQHILLLISLYVMTLGVAVCVCSAVGTLFAMVYVGMVVRLAGKHMKWFERLLMYKPGFRRYIYGLAKYIR